MKVTYNLMKKVGEKMKTCLTIAGSDPSGGAGIQADLKTFAAHGIYGMSVIVAVVAENTCEVRSIMDVSPAVIRDQMACVFEDIPPDAVKIGMLSQPETMQAVADALALYQPKNVVIDPVMLAKDGSALMASEALQLFKRRILPHARVFTPNIPEAEVLTGMTIRTEAEMRQAAKILRQEGAQAVLVKGGHLDGAAVDIFDDGVAVHRFEAARIPTKNTHGTGCTLSSAIASNLANGHVPHQAVNWAKAYITDAISHSLDLGKGNGPTHHFYRLYKEGLSWLDH